MAREAEQAVEDPDKAYQDETEEYEDGDEPKRGRKPGRGRGGRGGKGRGGKGRGKGQGKGKQSEQSSPNVPSSSRGRSPEKDGRSKKPGRDDAEPVKAQTPPKVRSQALKRLQRLRSNSSQTPNNPVRRTLEGDLNQVAGKKRKPKQPSAASKAVAKPKQPAKKAKTAPKHEHEKAKGDGVLPEQQKFHSAKARPGIQLHACWSSFLDF